jgi:hypothetical protein
MRTWLRVLVVMLPVCLIGCGPKGIDAPPPTGPDEYAQQKQRRIAPASATGEMNTSGRASNASTTSAPPPPQPSH